MQILNNLRLSLKHLEASLDRAPNLRHPHLDTVKELNIQDVYRMQNELERIRGHVALMQKDLDEFEAQSRPIWKRILNR